jgi:hypothetical protein
MKLFFTLASALALYSCVGEREVQVASVAVELVKIDTVSRNRMNEQVLTWRTSDDLQLVSFEPIGKTFNVGYKTVALMRR